MGTSPTGVPWTTGNESGTWGITSEQAYLASLTDNGRIAFETGLSDGEVEVVAEWDTTLTIFGLIVRYVNDQNFIWFEVVKGPVNDAISLRKLVNSVTSNVATFGVTNMAGGTPYLFGVSYKGDDIACKVNRDVVGV